ncbi:MAG: tetratricopeptide repeat protein [Saprospiraceae bacterium]|nr:tetratricopeptide repeat protein [Saprospiraceae bacterium]MDG1433157.1 tetratricopeptide repeat protein [Saprospiraceae bacterium]MDG2418661.1 tetratricopeptide repeat protein [Saprospiraceae bacterium]
MSIHLERGQLLIHQGRIGMAKKELRLELNQNPSNAYAMGLLGFCYSTQKDHKNAIQLIESAVGLEPNNSYLFYLLAKIYLLANRFQDSIAAADNGLLLNPNGAEFFLIKGSISLNLDHWEDSLKYAEMGLEADPEHLELINLRARSLIQLNRRKEAEATIDYALHKSPEDPLAHTNKGWIAIENNNYNEGVTHFKEALRLAPTFSFAKTGLKEAIKGKNIVYRQILKFFLWTNKMNDKGRWQLVIGAYIVYISSIKLAENYPALAPFFYPFIMFYIMFAFSSWIAQPLSNLFLRLHPLGKLALSEDEKIASNIVGTFLGIGITLFFVFFITNSFLWIALGIWFIIMLVPVGGIFMMEKSSRPRKYLTIYGVVIGFSGLAFIGLDLLVNIQVMPLIYAFILGIFFYGWVANYLVMKAAKEY